MLFQGTVYSDWPAWVTRPTWGFPEEESTGRAEVPSSWSPGTCPGSGSAILAPASCQALRLSTLGQHDQEEEKERNGQATSLYVIKNQTQSPNRSWKIARAVGKREREDDGTLKNETESIDCEPEDHEIRNHLIQSSCPCLVWCST